MNQKRSALFGPKPLAALLVGVSAWAAYLPPASDATLSSLARKFSFMRVALPVDVGAPPPSGSLLGPRYKHMEGYLTAFWPIGTALVDLRGTGLPEFACVADPFSGRVLVETLPIDAGAAPAPFALSPAPLPFDARGMRPTGCLPGDFNGDGRTDLLVYFWGRTPIVFVQGETAPNAALTADSFRAAELIAPMGVWYTQSMTAADVDGDGQLDLAVASYFPDDAKVLNDDRVGDSIMNKGYGSAYNGGVNRLVLNDGPVGGEPRFHEVPHLFDEMLGKQWTIAVGAADMNGDQLPELVFINDHGPDRFLLNKSKPGHPEFALIKNHRDFVTPKSKTFGQDDFHGMGLDFADLNLDGRLDFAVSNFGANYLFHQSHYAWIHEGDDALLERGEAPFVDRSESLGLARTTGVPWDLRFGDFDNDGKLEVLQALGFKRGTINRASELHENALMNDLAMQFPESWHNYGPGDDIAGREPNAFWTQDEHGHYVNLGPALGMAEPDVSRGIATGDVDGDGKVDFLIGNHHQPPTFYHNTSTSPGNFLALNVRLPYAPSDPTKIVARDGARALATGPTSRAAIGATVRLKRPDGKTVVAEVDGGSGFGGKRDPSVHFGLGAAPADARMDVTITWRDAKGERHEGTTTLAPGWHTLWLGSTPEFAEAHQ
jgi:hypothetical protein